MEENDENDYLSDLEDVSIKYEGYERNNNINYETNVIKKFNVCFYFDLTHLKGRTSLGKITNNKPTTSLASIFLFFFFTVVSNHFLKTYPFNALV